MSDAWLLASRWRRLLISMAGTYVDFLIWILAVAVWRFSFRETPLNYMAWIVVTTCGVRVLFNMNPLMRLDGYYALSDLVGVHNLRCRGRARWMDYLRWILWGGPRPESTEDGRALLIYGIVYWVFTVLFLNLLFFKLATFLHGFLGAWSFRREAFERVGGYPFIQSGQDQGLLRRFENAKLRRADPIQHDPRPSYVYRWFTAHSTHISAMGADGYERLAGVAVEQIDRIMPRWDVDWSALAAAELEAQP